MKVIRRKQETIKTIATTESTEMIESQQLPRIPANAKLLTSRLVTLFFWICLGAWLLAANALTDRLLFGQQIVWYTGVFFIFFYLGYSGLLAIFRAIGYHPKPEPLEVGSWGHSIALPVYTPLPADFRALVRQRSLHARKIQLSFQMIKFVLLLILAILFEFSLAFNLYVAIFVAVLFCLVNMTLTWSYVDLFKFKIVAKEYNRPFFEI